MFIGTDNALFPIARTTILGHNNDRVNYFSKEDFGFAVQLENVQAKIIKLKHTQDNKSLKSFLSKDIDGMIYYGDFSDNDKAEFHTNEFAKIIKETNSKCIISFVISQTDEPIDVEETNIPLVMKEGIGRTISLIDLGQKNMTIGASIIELLKKFVFIDEKEFENYLSHICHYLFDSFTDIFEDINKQKKTYYIGIPRGGQEVSMRFNKKFSKLFGEKLGNPWKPKKDQSKSSISDLNDELIEDMAALLVLDDIIGTGNTIVQELKKLPEGFDYENKSIFVLCIVGLEEVLQGVEIHNTDYVKHLEEPGEDVFIFLDPPYVKSAEKKLYGKNGDLHLEFDPYKFAEAVKKCEHKWMITYDDCELTRKLFESENIYGWELQYGMNNWKQEKAKKGQELFITNYDLEKVLRKNSKIQSTKMTDFL